MKLSILINKLEQIRAADERLEYTEIPGCTGKLVIQALLEYIDNKKITEAVDAIPF